MIRALRRGAMEELDGATQGIVHAHWWFPSGLAAPKLVPLVLTCHGTDVRMLERGAPIRWLAKGPFRRAAKVTTVSRSLAATLRSAGAAVADDAIVPMPVTLGDRPWSRGGGGVVVLGRLTEQKRVHLAIEAFARARERGYSGPLRIAGDGVTRAALHVLAGGLGLSDAIDFLGPIPPNAVSRLFASADVCLMPAIGEGFGLAAAEALMQGVPVVACTDGGGLLDVVPASGGGRHTAPTAKAIADGMLALLADPLARAAAHDVGKEWRERLTPAHVADCCLTWYREALHE
jgi:teichuronic acid biosynthesis glycosyltransferase TuaC